MEASQQQQQVLPSSKNDLSAHPTSLRSSTMDPIMEDTTVPTTGNSSASPAISRNPKPVDTNLLMSPIINFKTPKGNIELRKSLLDEGLDDDALPQIPGTRRLGNRRLSRMTLQSNVASPDLPVHPGKKNSIVALSIAQMSPGMKYRVYHPLSPAMTKRKPFQLNNATDTMGQHATEWNAEEFRLKRREAQMALELLPKYTAAMRQVDNSDSEETRFETIMAESITAHMDAEYECAAMEIIRDRLKARVFLSWKIAATALKQSRNKQAQLGRPRSFCSRLELLSSQGPRIPSRGITRGGSYVKQDQNVEKDLVWIRVDSSVTTADATDAIARASIDDETPHLEQSTDMVSDSAEAAVMIKQLYTDAAKVEREKTARNQRKSINPMAKVVSALVRIASSKSIKA